jgi:hypothetical protein
MTIELTVPDDYSTIEEACYWAGVSATEDNPATVFIRNGVYTPTQWLASGYGMVIPDYVSLSGESKDGVILQGHSGSIFGPISNPGDNAFHRNLTLMSHRDNSSIVTQTNVFGKLYWQYCDFIVGNPSSYTFNSFAKQGCDIKHNNCKFTGRYTLSGISTGRDAADEPYRYQFTMCQMTDLGFVNYIEYMANKLEFAQTTLTINISQILSQYNANPDDPLYNQGYIPDTPEVWILGTSKVTVPTGKPLHYLEERSVYYDIDDYLEGWDHVPHSIEELRHRFGR